MMPPVRQSHSCACVCVWCAGVGSVIGDRAQGEEEVVVELREEEEQAVNEEEEEEEEDEEGTEGLGGVRGGERSMGAERFMGVGGERSTGAERSGAGSGSAAVGGPQQAAGAKGWTEVGHLTIHITPPTPTAEPTTAAEAGTAGQGGRQQGCLGALCHALESLSPLAPHLRLLQLPGGPVGLLPEVLPTISSSPLGQV